MKDTGGTSYGGNNRQDYSLVDRFSGGYYLIEYDDATEKRLLYAKVYETSKILRNFLDSVGAIESISLRTMLNFNRIYEQEMLKALQSPLALDIAKVKTLKDSVNSFIDAINPKSTAEKLRNETDIVSILDERQDLAGFIQEFWNFHGDQSVITGDIISKEDMEELVAKFS
jgi:cobaltochelatase CobS